jgi:hypothetical protein
VSQVILDTLSLLLKRLAVDMADEQVESTPAHPEGEEISEPAQLRARVRELEAKENTWRVQAEVEADLVATRVRERQEHEAALDAERAKAMTLAKALVEAEAVVAQGRAKTTVPHPPKFSGKRDANLTLKDWLFAVKNYLKLGHVPVDQHVATAQGFLENPALAIWNTYSNYKPTNDWSVFEAGLTQSFGIEHLGTKTRSELRRLRQTTSVEAYNHAFIQLALRLAGEEEMSRAEKRYDYLAGLKANIRDALPMAPDFKDWELIELMRRAKEMDQMFMLTQGAEQQQKRSEPGPSRAPGPSVKSKGQFVRNKQKRPASHDVASQNSQAKKAKSKAKMAELKEKNLCFVCEQSGHTARECPRNDSKSEPSRDPKGKRPAK